MANPILPLEEASEFDGLPPEAVAAFVFRDGGEPALRAVFEQANDIEPQTAESLEQIVSALELRGLSAPAAILREIAAKTPSGIDSNPYREGTTNWSEWRRSWIRRQRQTTGELEADLRGRMSGKSQKHSNSWR